MTSTTRLAVPALVALYFLGAPVGAQISTPATADSVPQRPPGPVMRRARLRISYEHGSTIGTLISASPDSITLYTDDVAQTFPRAPMTRVEVSAGSNTNKGRYARIGGISGAVLGVILGQGDSGLTCDVTVGCDGLNKVGPAVSIAGGIVLGLLGSVTGALVGQFHHTEQWTTVTSSNP